MHALVDERTAEALVGLASPREPLDGGRLQHRGHLRVVHDRVTSVFRHDSLEAALAATELTEADLTG